MELTIVVLVTAASTMVTVLVARRLLRRQSLPPVRYRRGPRVLESDRDRGPMSVACSRCFFTFYGFPTRADAYCFVTEHDVYCRGRDRYEESMHSPDKVG